MKKETQIFEGGRSLKEKSKNQKIASPKILKIEKVSKHNLKAVEYETRLIMKRHYLVSDSD